MPIVQTNYYGSNARIHLIDNGFTIKHTIGILTWRVCVQIACAYQYNNMSEVSAASTWRRA